MPKRLKLEPYLSVDELKALYRRAKEGVERSHYQILWLIALDKSTQQVAEITGYSPNWIRILVRRYNRWGPQAIEDGRHRNLGADPLLNDVQQAQLWQMLQGPAPDGGLWNGRKVAEWMSEVTGREIDRYRGWEYWRQLKPRLREPRPNRKGSSKRNSSGGMQNTPNHGSNSPS
jgi:transposase